MLKCAVFASGSGSNFQALIDRARSGDLHADLALFIGNNSAAVAFQRARDAAIPALHLAPSHFPDEATYADRLLSVLKSKAVELIVLSGYMKKIPAAVVAAYPNRIVNIHPALLPAFGGPGLYGEKVHQAVLDYGAKVSGVTIHFVDEHYDHGPIIFQEALPVLDGDDARALAKRVLSLEHAHYWRVIEAIAQGKITVQGRRVYGVV
ncbi:MAG TPA: phosphoribosylglycinamide formyltransferase [Chitinivibrionales bacterium]